MIKSLTVTNHVGESLYMDLTKPEDTGIIIAGITGLGPGHANVNISDFSTTDGGILNSVRRGSRNIVIQTMFMERDTIEDTRLLTYRFFPLRKLVTLKIETDRRLVEIDGVVENNDPVIFSHKEGSDISIICPYPYFRSAGEGALEITTFYGIDPMFEFPFSNESVEEPLLIMGNIRQRSEAIVPYEGDVDCGITIIIQAIGEVSNITIYNLDTREYMKIDDEKLIELTGDRIHKGDEITIRSDVGNKSITLLREGRRINILNAVGAHPSWFVVTKGDNRFAYTVDSGLLNMTFRMENRILYDGI